MRRAPSQRRLGRMTCIHENARAQKRRTPELAEQDRRWGVQPMRCPDCGLTWMRREEGGPRPYCVE